MSAARAVRLAAAGLSLLVSAACGHQGLSFVKDDRVTIVAPRDRAKVRLPVTVRWTVEDFTVTGRTGSSRPDEGYFGVFVDRPPQPPGRTFRWFAQSDHQCEVVPGCPDRGYFAARGAYDTNETSFVIENIPELRPQRERRFRDFHEVIVVLLDGNGRRIGESAFAVEFELERLTP